MATNGALRFRVWLPLRTHIFIVQKKKKFEKSTTVLCPAHTYGIEGHDRPHVR